MPDPCLTPEQTKRVEDAYQLIPLIAARPCFRIPPGLNRDDLESHGSQVLMEAAVVYDPDTHGEWKEYARGELYSGFRRFLSRAWDRGKRERTDAPDPDTGRQIERADPDADDPAGTAIARETMAPPQVIYLPSPAAVRDRVHKLRAAMFGSIREEDVAAIMGRVMTAAKLGDMKAANVVVNLLRPKYGEKD